ncbi:MAG: hypothetical protein ACLRL4_10310 [Bifidobacterium bifidum]
MGRQCAPVQYHVDAAIQWSNLKRLFDRRSTFEIRSGPFEYECIRIGFDDDLIRWTVSCGWWHPKTTTIYTDYGTTMRVLFEHGYDLWRKDNGIMDETDKAIRSLNESNIPSMRSTDPDHLVFEVGENVFRALLPADPMRAAGLLIGAVRGREGIIADYRKAIKVLAGSSPCPTMTWPGMTCSRTADRSKSGPSYSKPKAGPPAWTCWSCPDGTWHPDGFDQTRRHGQ